MTIMIDGWNYTGTPLPNGDARKIVSLEQDDMCWVGIRAYNHAAGGWMNNNEPEAATVKAWRDMPEPAKGFWDRGILRVPDAQGRYSEHGKL